MLLTMEMPDTAVPCLTPQFPGISLAFNLSILHLHQTKSISFHFSKVFSHHGKENKRYDFLLLPRGCGGAFLVLISGMGQPLMNQTLGKKLNTTSIGI